MPPRGIPPFNFIGLALIVVMLSKHRVKLTKGTGEETIAILFDVAGLLVTQERFEVIMHQILSPGWGENEKLGELLPVLPPFTFH